MELLEVRCCCNPGKLLGYLPDAGHIRLGLVKFRLSNSVDSVTLEIANFVGDHKSRDFLITSMSAFPTGHISRKTSQLKRCGKFLSLLS